MAVRCSAYAVSVYAVCVCYSACNVEPSTRNIYTAYQRGAAHQRDADAQLSLVGARVSAYV